jgi:hypothetical protein
MTKVVQDRRALPGVETFHIESSSVGQRCRAVTVEVPRHRAYGVDPETGHQSEAPTVTLSLQWKSSPFSACCCELRHSYRAQPSGTISGSGWVEYKIREVFRKEHTMAKKRRGRPPGSKNKKSFSKTFALMDINQLRAHISGFKAHSRKRSATSALISRSSFPSSAIMFRRSQAGRLRPTPRTVGLATAPGRSRNINLRRTNR